MNAIARTLINRLEQLPPTGDHESSTGRALGDARLRQARNAVVSTVRSLRDQYGETDAAELMLWISRNEVDWTSRERWWSWWLFLSGVARGTRVPQSISERSTSHLLSVAETLVDPAFDRRLDAATDAADAIVLDSDELALTRYATGTIGEPSYQEVVVDMRVATLRERAYLGRRLVAMVLADEEMRKLERDAAAELGGGG